MLVFFVFLAWDWSAVTLPLFGFYCPMAIVSSTSVPALTVITPQRGPDLRLEVGAKVLIYSLVALFGKDLLQSLYHPLITRR